ncbi:hypothetical protein CMK19_00855 [Candidatus Poribacteria bacterium]|nr:hypothetical protein [Candidatus Poribacteria bacterium]|tara:strand:+ start:1420 stop:1605 length:186 start_codon:yes stop_codon:yes gene_type:complete
MRGYASKRGGGGGGGRTVTKPQGGKRSDVGTKLGRPATPGDNNPIISTNRESGPRLRHPKG